MLTYARTSYAGGWMTGPFPPPSWLFLVMLLPSAAIGLLVASWPDTSPARAPRAIYRHPAGRIPATAVTGSTTFRPHVSPQIQVPDPAQFAVYT